MTAFAGPAVRPPFLGLPPNHGPGLRIGLFGGSFNPPHAGHRLASLIALHRLGLDRVWWLVSPGNPLKDTRHLSPLRDRLAAAASVADHPRIEVTGVEAALGLRYTADVLRALTLRCPGVRFVWIMGADNLAGFHRWQRWAAIAETVPIAVIDRPGSTLHTLHGRAGTYLDRWRLPERAARRLADRGPPGFVFLHGPRSPLSSTALRAEHIEADGSAHPLSPGRPPSPLAGEGPAKPG